jgi:hypothetical protein
MLNIAAAGEPVPEIFRAPGFILEYIAIDAMHCADLGFLVSLCSS